MYSDTKKLSFLFTFLHRIKPFEVKNTVSAEQSTHFFIKCLLSIESVHKYFVG